MDVIECPSVAQAIDHCHALMSERPNSYEAHVYKAARRLHVIARRTEHRVFERGVRDAIKPPLTQGPTIRR
jgi:hypothetical protein